ncbi:accessory Sec system protein translocase subunit SecY2 [Gemella sp. GH3]|uniref:accessory Sec system protein translocase subunit SecY2 n=1 Tax=unclassified Gemella TaxID=2624949 RepID=UPI0015D04110|nr:MULTISPECIES: accessory Sec system protein translocase subunit SecY2 [unclassified Gemella]MBF0714052.1 accessory Sec system protein translocase subunit SecY2 [Gemella sp. GH3.1]NYS51004.1 accessory Sec system protein translocase subunit SecY2 [Gemella sp. GH3]
MNSSNNILRNKLLWLTLIIMIYILGSNIPIPNVAVNLGNLSEDNQFLEIASSTTGGNLLGTSLFALGLGPWMSSLIIWRVLSLSKKLKIKSLAPKKSQRIQMILMLVIALLQGYVLAGNFEYVNNENVKFNIFSTLAILIAGTFFLVWLGNMNNLKGLGGPIVIVVVGIVKQWAGQIFNLFLEKYSYYNQYKIFFILIVLLGVFIMVLVMILFEMAEYRVPVNRVLINNEYFEKSYLAIKLNPAGGLPVMYALSITVLPSYIIRFLLRFYPDNEALKVILKNIDITEVYGVLIYILCLITLTIGFAFLNVNPEEISENLRKNGDYIDNIRPGKNTEKYLSRIVFKFSIIGSIYIVILAGLPVIYSISSKQGFKYMMISGTVLILSSLVYNILEQVKIILIRNKYKTLF